LKSRFGILGCSSVLPSLFEIPRLPELGLSPGTDLVRPLIARWSKPVLHQCPQKKIKIAEKQLMPGAPNYLVKSEML
jgi:hypothetical protein